MLPIVNLEEGMPSVEQARQLLLREVERLRRAGQKGVKLIHGYGSSGVGGDIRIALGRVLQEMRSRDELTHVIFGEDWAVTNSTTWALLKRHPQLKNDRDLGRNNRGITVVWF